MKRFAISLLTLAVLYFSLDAQEKPQVYNMNFDTWSKTSGAWNLYPEKPTAGQKVWDTANHGLSLLGINGTLPEYKHVAVSGQGKAAAKIVSKKVVWAFVAGNLYTGWFGKIVKLSGAELNFGVPFSARPKSLSGYVHYQSGTIDFAQEPYLAMKGKSDQGQIEIALYAWKERQHFVSNDGPSTPADRDPAFIGGGVITLDKDTNGYIPFEIKIDYRSEAIPTYIYISALSSRFGEFFTGSSQSVLYVDEFRLNY